MTKRKLPPEFVVPTTITVADESAIVAMIEHSAEPTQALVELMAETTNTTSKYDRRGQRAGRAAVNRLVLRGAGK